MANATCQEIIDQFLSCLHAISKVMERILYTRIYEFLTKKTEHQFDFRKFHSTASAALFDCTNDWYVNMDKK